MRFPTLTDVLVTHDALISAYGGEHGVRHVGAIEAALARAHHGPFEVGDLGERAALVLRGIVEDHPFVDGNKRTGLAMCETVLGLNGWVLSGSDEDLLVFVIEVARGRHSLEEIAGWIRERMERL